MKSTFYVMVADSATPPRVAHLSFQSAFTEAKRLRKALVKVRVDVLEVVATIDDVEVPVTRKEERTVIADKYSADDLPF